MPQDLELTQAAQDVLTERRRQIEEEGFGPSHDERHWDGSLAVAAAGYAQSAAGDPQPIWPQDWGIGWFRPTTPRRDLVKAGALILAEIERLDRKGG